MRAHQLAPVRATGGEYPPLEDDPADDDPALGVAVGRSPSENTRLSDEPLDDDDESADDAEVPPVVLALVAAWSPAAIHPASTPAAPTLSAATTTRPRVPMSRDFPAIGKVCPASHEEGLRNA